MAKLSKIRKAPTKSQIKSWIKDEKKTAKEYKKYGFSKQAADEAKHARHFKRLQWVQDASGMWRPVKVYG